jgi:hypothetical protein
MKACVRLNVAPIRAGESVARPDVAAACWSRLGLGITHCG